MANPTCHTAGCVNADVAVVVDLDVVDPDGNPTRVDAIYCGGCGQPITDIEEAWR